MEHHGWIVSGSDLMFSAVAGDRLRSAKLQIFLYHHYLTDVRSQPFLRIDYYRVVAWDTQNLYPYIWQIPAKYPPR